MGLFDGTPLERPVLCDRCSQVLDSCDCPPLEEPDAAPESQRLKVGVEKRKRGKVVTVIRGFTCRESQLQLLLNKLKNHCGAGGTVDDQSIEVQGDHSSRVSAFLKNCGYRL